MNKKQQIANLMQQKGEAIHLPNDVRKIENRKDRRKAKEELKRFIVR